MAMIDNGGLSPLGACRLWGINKSGQESACDCQMVVTDKGFLLVPVDRPHWIFRGRTGSKKSVAYMQGLTVINRGGRF